MISGTLAALLLAAVLYIRLQSQRSTNSRPAGAAPAASVAPTYADRVKGGIATFGKPFVPDVLEIAHLERRIFAAIFDTGFVTVRERILKLGNTVVVAVSPDALARLRPVELEVSQELKVLLEERAEREGWRVLGSLRITLRADPALVRDQVVARAVVDEDTPAMSRQTRVPSGRPSAAAAIGNETPVVRLHLVGADGRAARSGGGDGVTSSFALPSDGAQVVVGRSSACDWRPTADRDSLVSRVHLKANLQQFSQDGLVTWGVRVIDQETPHGTYVDGERTEGAALLSHGDTVRLGPRLTLRVTVGTSTDEDTPEQR